MLNRRRKRDGDESGVDIAPLIDVVFLLLVFFMSIWQAAHMEVSAKLTLPITDVLNPEEQRDADRLVVNVDENSVYWVSNRRLTLEELRDSVLRPEAMRNRDVSGFSTRPVFIRAHQEVEWAYVRDVMVACREVGIWKLAFRVATPQED